MTNCTKSECIKIWCRVCCILMVLAQCAIVVNILFCIGFHCSLLERHVFYAINLLLKLFSYSLDNANFKPNYFYIYVIGNNVLSIVFYGVITTSSSNHDSKDMINNICFLGLVVIVCFVNLLQNSALFILIVFIGIDHDVPVQMEAVFLSIFEVLQIATLSILIATFNDRYKEMRKDKAFLFSATLIQNQKNEEPLLVR